MIPDPDSLSAFQARSQLKEALQHAWDRCSAESTPLAIVLVAFDKQASAEGVDTLQRALEVHCARTHDRILRQTNDQFAAILPDTSPSGARLIGDRLVEAMRLAGEGSANRISAGFAVAVPDDQHDPADLLRRAEHSLEAAREKGGDRILGAASPAPSSVPTSLRAFLASALRQKPAASSRRQGD